MALRAPRIVLSILLLYLSQCAAMVMVLGGAATTTLAWKVSREVRHPFASKQECERFRGYLCSPDGPRRLLQLNPAVESVTRDAVSPGSSDPEEVTATLSPLFEMWSVSIRPVVAFHVKRPKMGSVKLDCISSGIDIRGPQKLVNAARGVVPETFSSYDVRVEDTFVASEATIELSLPMPPMPGLLRGVLNKQMPRVLGRTLENDVRESLALMVAESRKRSA